MLAPHPLHSCSPHLLHAMPACFPAQIGNHQALDKAIEVVQKTHNHTIGVLIMDYVNEEVDGSAKDEFRWGQCKRGSGVKGGQG